MAREWNDGRTPEERAAWRKSLPGLLQEVETCSTRLVRAMNKLEEGGVKCAPMGNRTVQTLGGETIVRHTFSIITGEPEDPF